MTTTFTVTAKGQVTLHKGQVTLHKELLRHLEVAPGRKVEVELLPSGRLEFRAKPAGSIEDFSAASAEPEPSR